MKIALDTQLPDQIQYAELISSIQDEGTQPDSNPDYASWGQSPYVLAAYDQGRLVGMGMVDNEADAGAGYRLAVHPQYRGRNIEQYMRKLLAVKHI